jgi:hypothetical protein
MSIVEKIAKNPYLNPIVGKAGKAISTVGKAVGAPQIMPGDSEQSYKRLPVITHQSRHTLLLSKCKGLKHKL